MRRIRFRRRRIPLPYIEHALVGEAWTAHMLSENPEIGAETRNAYLWAEEQFLRIARGEVGERDLIG